VTAILCEPNLSFDVNMSSNAQVSASAYALVMEMAHRRGLADALVWRDPHLHKSFPSSSMAAYDVTALVLAARVARRKKRVPRGGHAFFIAHARADCTQEAMCMKLWLEHVLSCTVYVSSRDQASSSADSSDMRSTSWDASWLSGGLLRRSARPSAQARTLAGVEDVFDHVARSQVLLLLQTQRCLHRPWVLMECFFAACHGIPIVPVLIDCEDAGARYDFGAAARLFESLPEVLEASNPGATDCLRQLLLGEAGTEGGHMTTSLNEDDRKLADSRLELLRSTLGDVIPNQLTRCKMPAKQDASIARLMALVTEIIDASDEESVITNAEHYGERLADTRSALERDRQVKRAPSPSSGTWAIVRERMSAVKRQASTRDSHMAVTMERSERV